MGREQNKLKYSNLSGELEVGYFFELWKNSTRSVKKN